MAAGSELFSYLTCLHTTTLVFLSIFSLAETISIKMRNVYFPCASVVQKRRSIKLSDVLQYGRFGNWQTKFNSTRS